MAIHQKLTPFKTPVNYNQNDSFQDPYLYAAQNPLILTHSKTPTLDYIAFSFSMGDTLQSDNENLHGRLPKKLVLSGPPVHSEFWTPFKIPVNHTSHSVNGLLSRPFIRGKEQQSTLQYSISHLLDSFQDPALEIKRTQDNWTDHSSSSSHHREDIIVHDF